MWCGGGGGGGDGGWWWRGSGSGHNHVHGHGRGCGVKRTRERQRGERHHRQSRPCTCRSRYQQQEQQRRRPFYIDRVGLCQNLRPRWYQKLAGFYPNKDEQGCDPNSASWSSFFFSHPFYFTPVNGHRTSATPSQLFFLPHKPHLYYVKPNIHPPKLRRLRRGRSGQSIHRPTFQTPRPSNSSPHVGAGAMAGATCMPLHVPLAVLCLAFTMTIAFPFTYSPPHPLLGHP